MIALEFFALGAKVKNIYACFCTPVCRKYEINQTAFDLLMFLANNPGHNTARDVCEIRGIKSGIVSIAVDSLIGRGLIASEDDREDRRVKRLSPTDAAADIIKEGRAIQGGFFRAIADGITQEELIKYGEITGKFAENIRRLDREVKKND